MLEWIRSHEALLWWAATGSVVVFVGTLLAIPPMVVRIPTDYFTHRKRHRTPWSEHHPVVRAILIAGKNLLGGVFLLSGIAMLVLPGQGILCMVIGVMLLDFPGKYRLERWAVERRFVLRSINWLRRRGGHPPLAVHRRAPGPASAPAAERGP
ncbi:MAG: hypothetical protein ACYTG1_01005 [Planctomycetota bacterium]|jgi:hypothetical protein